jgi:hypothetical protein
MKLLLSFLLLTSLNSFSQSGCTNIWALNFDPLASSDDGSCDSFQSIVSYNAQLNDPITVGTGISNLHAAILDHGPIQLGLKVNKRFVADVVPTNNNEYHVLTGFSQTSFFDPTPVPGIGTWDFIYSINLGDYTFADLQIFVSIDFDPIDGPTQSAAFDLPVSSVMASIGQSSASFKQGSENLGFNYWLAIAGPSASNYDPLSPGVYDISIRVENLASNVLGSAQIKVIADEPIDGCTAQDACNYNPSANVDDNTCVFATAYADCDGNCLNDFNNNGICDDLEIIGCTYVTAVNYSAQATMDDGTCIFEDCDLSDCAAADFNNDGIVGVSDLFIFLSLYNTTCAAE